MTEEKKCPVTGGARRPTAGSGTSNRDWWPNQLNLHVLHQHSPLSDPMGEAFDYAAEFEKPRPRRGQEGPLRADDRLAGLVAGRLRSLRGALHPDGVAQRRHLPHRRRPRRRRLRHAALRAAQQLARQRQPRQGAPSAVADQAEVRPEDLLGRPDDPRRQLRPGVDGLQDVRLRRRARRRLGAGGGHLLGQGGHLARGQALHRRPGARGPPRRRADGPDLREPGRARRPPRPGRVGARHPRDLRPHGDERRGDRRPRRGRAHLRQVPRRRRSNPRGSRARSRRPRRAGPRLEEQLRQRQGERRDHQRPGRPVDAEPREVGHGLLRHALRQRVGADQEPGRGLAVEAEGRGRKEPRALRPRSVEAGSGHDDHGGHGHADGPDLRADRAALPREPGGVRRRLRPRVVQADPPRHGPALALPRPGGPPGGPPVAGPRPRRSPTS